MATETKVKKVKAFWWLSGITIGYFAIYYLLIAETQACAGVPIQSHWFHGFWDRYLGCRSVNELGDALAGAFAPVAFLWLAGAVFIQSKELEAQREELNETQEVMREQVEEMRASTALLRQQTEAMQKDQLRKDQELADQEFNAEIEMTLQLIKDLRELYLLQYSLSDEGGELSIASLDHTMLFDVSSGRVPPIDDIIASITASASRLNRVVKNTRLPEGYSWAWSSDRGDELISECFSRLNDSSKPLSPAFRVHRLRLGIPLAQTEFEALRASISNANAANAKMD